MTVDGRVEVVPAATGLDVVHDVLLGVIEVRVPHEL
jgi:hypothetical protein